jgi:Protein of unknwon function (DUF3310)
MAQSKKPSQRRVGNTRTELPSVDVTWRLANREDVNTSANSKQVDGDHYKKLGIEVWDIAVLNNLDPFQFSILRYLMRWYEKDGIQDLEKIAHFVQKYIELAKMGYRDPNASEETQRKLREYVVGLYAGGDSN